MPAPSWIRYFNRRVTNRILGPLATKLPLFGVIEHTGRKSGRVYRTPINVFRSGDRYVVALTYGPHTDWLRNAIAAGEVVLATREGCVKLTEPRVFHDPERRAMPRPVRAILSVARVSDFVEFRAAQAERRYA